MNVDRFLVALIDRSPPHVLEHLQLVGVVLFFTVLIAFPLGVMLTRPRLRKYAGRVLFFLNAGQTIPPLAVISIFMPVFGLGFRPAAVALIIYSLLPIVRNTIAGILGVPEEVRQAARGMGMNQWELFYQVELPLSVPVIMAGLKTSSVLLVGTATLASLVGGGGMGRVIFAGIDMFWPEFIIAGTLIVGAMAVVIDRGLTLLELFLIPRHLK